MKLSFEYIKKILEFMNEFSVHKVEFKPQENEYIRIIIKKPLDYNKNYFTVLLEDLETVYYNGRSSVFDCAHFNNLEEFINSKIYTTIKGYTLKNKIITI